MSMTNTAVERLLATARSEVGYLEKASNSNLDDKTANAGRGNWTKYARDLNELGDFYNGNKNGYDWCFTAGTLVLTDNGYKEIQDIEVGDRVLNATGTRFNTITHVAEHDAETILVRAYGALPFRVTPDHPVLSQRRKCYDHRYEGFKDYGFNRIGELKKKDVIAFPKSPVLFENCLSYDELWMIGYYVGDGYTTGGRYKVCASEAKAHEVDKHADGNKQLCFQTCIEYELKKVGHAEMIKVMSHCGSSAYDKAIPMEILFGTNEVKQAFLDGYLSADGCIKNKGFNTVSPKLATSMSRLLFDLGLGCSINPQKRPPRGKIWDKRLNAFRTFNQREVIYNCGWNDAEDSGRQYFVPSENMVFVPIKEKSDDVEVATVYTLTTDGDHTYTANNLGVHNCDVFTDWCFVETFGKELALQLLGAPTKSCGAGCKYSAGYYQTKGQFYTGNPQPGDQIFFGTDTVWQHTGLVEKVTDKYVYTIEGNTSGASGVVANGGGVASKKYLLTNKNIKGYGRPDWSLVQTTQQPTQTPVQPQVQTSPLSPVNKVNPIKPVTLLSGDSMTQNEFEAKWRTMRAKWQSADPSEWSEDAREWAVKKGLIVGSSATNPNYMWGDMLTREQAAVLLYRFAKMLGVD